jgi:hypothetical protein
MANRIVLRFPDHTTRDLTPEEAGRAVEQLWALGLVPGAALCAVQILETLQRPAVWRLPLMLDEREASAARQVLDAAPHVPSAA